MISQAVISKTPIIFYNTVAIDKGEMDIIIEPQETGFLNEYGLFLNYTKVQIELEKEIDNLITPRFETTILISGKKFDQTKLKEGDQNSSNVTLVLLDIEKETGMEIDADKITPLLPGEAYLSSSLTKVLGTKVNETFYMAFYIEELDWVVKSIATYNGIPFSNNEEFAV
jgi:hypothetical protein